jgi:hypothetical protein
MANGWTPERRARQAEMIRTWRPWEKSTGPRTPDGKAKASVNADMAQGCTPEVKDERDAVREFMREWKELLRRHRDLLRRANGHAGACGFLPARCLRG